MTMFFTRTDKTLRIWFAAITSAGAYRTGLAQSNFLAQVINPADSANITAQVFESTQRAGVYYFDVPASFLTTNGIGDYMASVKIDSTSGTNSGAPQVKSVESNVVHVTREDFDSLSGSIWNTPNGSFNTSGTMGALVNMIAAVSASTTQTAIAQAVWNAVAANFNTSGTFGWEVNQVFASQSMSVVTVPSIVSGVWNANLTNFNTVGTFGGAVNEALQDIKFHLSATFIASGSISSSNTSLAHVATTINGTTVANQFNGQVLMIMSPGTGSESRLIDTYMTGVFDVDPPFLIGSPGDAVFVLSTVFVPGHGSIG